MIAVNTIGGGDLGFDALMYKPPTEQVMNYINTNIARATEVLGNAGSNFINHVKNTYDKFNNQSVINMGKSILYGVGSHMNDNVVMPLTMDRLPTANHIMQQYIIAQPEVNAMLQDNMCYGFQETYYDIEPGVVGTERNDYRRVMSGVVQHDEEEDLDYMVQYTSGDDEDETDLDPMDKLSVLDTWDSVMQALAAGIDPTSPDGDEL